MSKTQVFVSLFAIVSVAVALFAIWRVARAPDVKHKPLWIVGSLFGFFGFATRFDGAGDLYMQVGIQIPVIVWTGSSGSVLKVMFPVVAAVALVKLGPSGGPSTR